MLFAQLRHWLLRLPISANPTLQHACLPLPHRFSFRFCPLAVSDAIPDIHLTRWGNLLPVFARCSSPVFARCLNIRPSISWKMQQLPCLVNGFCRQYQPPFQPALCYRCGAFYDGLQLHTVICPRDCHPQGPAETNWRESSSTNRTLNK